MGSWVKAAQKLIRRSDDALVSDELHVLLAQLEHLDRRLAAQLLEDSTNQDHSREQRRYVIREAKREIGRLNKAQQAILHRVKMHDVFELESAIEKAIRRQELHQQWRQLDEEITDQLNACDDGVEVRELLESYDLPELQDRHDELLAHQAELEKLRHVVQSSAATSTTATIDEAELIRELEFLNRQLAEAEQTLERLEQQQVEAAAECVRENEELPDKCLTTKSEQPRRRFEYLARLTAGRYDTMRLDEGQLVLSLSRLGAKRCTVDLDSDLSRLNLVGAAIAFSVNAPAEARRVDAAAVVLADNLFCPASGERHLRCF